MTQPHLVVAPAFMQQQQQHFDLIAVDENTQSDIMLVPLPPLMPSDSVLVHAPPKLDSRLDDL